MMRFKWRFKIVSSKYKIKIIFIIIIIYEYELHFTSVSLFSAKFDLIAQKKNFSEYIELLETSYNVRCFKRTAIRELMYSLFFTFDINKLFEHRDTFTKMNQLHSFCIKGGHQRSDYT